MLPTVLPRTGGKCPPVAGQSDRPVARRRAKRPSLPALRVVQSRGDRGAVAASLDATPLGRVRLAMSRHQVDAILVLGRNGTAPLRWVTRDGLVRTADGSPSLLGARQAIGDVVADLGELTSFARLRELVREPDVARVLIWRNSKPLAIVTADKLFAETETAAQRPPGRGRLRRAPGHAGQPVPALAGHGRRLLVLVARAPTGADGWSSESQLESMVAGGRLEWRVTALEVLTAAGLLERVQRAGQFDYRLTRRGLEVADAHSAASSSGARQPPRRR